MSDVAPYYLKWLEKMDNLGPISAYKQPGGFDQYPPLAVSGAFLIRVISGAPYLLCWKIAGAMALVAVTEIIFRQTKSTKYSLISIAVLGIPTLWWGYADVYTVPWILASLFLFLNSRYFYSGLFFAIGCLFKWQPIILLPGIFFYILANKRFKLLSSFIFGGASIGFLMTLIYGWYNPMKSIWLSSLNHYFSAWGPNFYWIVTWILSTKLPSTLVGLGIWGGGSAPDGSFGSLRGNPKTGLFVIAKILFYGFYSTVTFFFAQKTQYSSLNVVRIASIAALIYWQLSTGVHANHIFFFFPLSLILIWKSANYFFPIMLLFGLVNLNIYARLGINGQGLFGISSTIYQAYLSLFLSVISVGLGIYLMVSLFTNGKNESKSTRS